MLGKNFIKVKENLEVSCQSPNHQLSGKTAESLELWSRELGV